MTKTATPITVTLEGEEDTLALGGRLATGLQESCRLYLHGDLGAGKTTLVRGLLRGLGFEGRVKSPTFSLVEPYEFSSLSLYHFDFYRFDEPGELRDSGLLEHFDGPAVCIVEWPARAGPQLPPPDLEIDLSPREGGGRSAVLVARSHRGEHWLEQALK
jgi:tRNA threonylcarbamoyladenosine biosynthesis protein TsaE